MKTFLFLIAFAFNLFLVFHPFEVDSQNAEPSIKVNTANPVEYTHELQPETKGLAYSDMLKNKACGLQKQ